MDADVIVVGAGLAGLSAAVELDRRGRQVLVLEADDDVGGRVRTDEVDGYLLDRGFQVLLTAYPTARRLLDYDALELGTFRPGAYVRVDDGFDLAADPFRRLEDLTATVRSGVGSPLDKLRMLRLRHRVRRGSVDDLFAGVDETVEYRLRELGFSPAMLDRFFRPLYGGISLDDELTSSAHVFEFVLRMLSEGDCALPAGGMAALPRQLAAGLPGGAVRLGAAVEKVTPGSVMVGGQELTAERVIVATDASAAAGLVDGVTDAGWVGVTTLWFAAEKPPFDQPYIILGGGEEGPINNVAVVSRVASSYAPLGHDLIGVSTPRVGVADLELDVGRQLYDWWGPSTETWDLLRVDEIPRAQPRQLPGFEHDAALDVGGIVVAGDHRRTASIDGALRSGLDAATLILASST